MTGFCNDIDVLDRSNVCLDKINGVAPIISYTVDNHYTIDYFLANDIYPHWQVFVKSVAFPLGNKQKDFASKQEVAWEDVEHCFGGLQTKWHIVTTPCCLWQGDKMHTMMKACILFHNMIREDESHLDFPHDDEEIVTLINISSPFTTQPGIVDPLINIFDRERTTKSMKVKDGMIVWLQILLSFSGCFIVLGQ